MLIAVLFLWHEIHIHVREDHLKTSPTNLAAAVSNEPHIQNVALPVSATPRMQQLSHSADKKAARPARQLTTPSGAASVGTQSPVPESLSSSRKKEQLSLAGMLSIAEPRAADAKTSLRVKSSDQDKSLPRLAGPPQSRMIYPRYPETHKSGKVVLTAVVAPDGTIKSITVISGKKIFAGAAVNAVRKWRYLPYASQGKPIEFQTTIAFNFRGDEVISVSFPQL